jgi:hypothetical protein
MPGFIPMIGDVLQVKTRCFFVNQVSLNVLHYSVNAYVGAGLNLVEIADKLSARLSTDYRALMSSEVTYEGLSVQNITPARTVPYNSVTGKGVGTVGTKSCPSQTSFIIKLRSALAGRRNIGHVYPGFPAANFQDFQGRITQAGQDALADLATDLGPSLLLANGPDSVQLQLCIRHPDKNVPLPGTPDATPAYECIPSTLWATQRRRGDYGAANRPFP